MEEIKVGEYVRTKNGYIGMVENINDFRPPEAKICIDINMDDFIFIDEKLIIKHSPNIIDLIEVGDIITVEEIDTEWERTVEVDEEEYIKYLKM